MDISNDIDIHPHKEFNLIKDFSSESRFEHQNVVHIEACGHFLNSKALKMGTIWLLFNSFLL